MQDDRSADHALSVLLARNQPTAKIRAIGTIILFHQNDVKLRREQFLIGNKIIDDKDILNIIYELDCGSLNVNF